MTSNIEMNFGCKLYQIKALVSFGNVEAGELGGYVESEENLSQTGDAWVYGNARVYGDAWVGGEIRVECGCFSGTIQEFEDAVAETHGDNIHAQTYKAAIQLAKIKFNKKESKEE